MNKIDKNKLLSKLSSDEFHVTQNKGTEQPFTGKYLDNKEIGTYRCICCGTELFLSRTIFLLSIGLVISTWSIASLISR